MQYGRVCPQGPRGTWNDDEESWLFFYDDGVQGEDCLRVNIWTPGINDNKKRPVMVWLHGGGFVSGSCQEHRSYDGERLSRRGDVVIVSLNHRLGPLGYLNLAPYGEKYASSAHLGMLDIVWPWNGCATTLPISAAIPAMSLSSASPGAAAKWEP